MKKSLLLIGAVLLICIKTFCYSADFEKADSLFKAKKFTQAHEVYEKCIHEGGIISPQALLRMAYVEEGLGEYAKALYYLNMYYVNFGDKSVLRKMEELAEAQDLSGYKFTDTDYFAAFYQENEMTIGIGTAMILAIWFLLILQSKSKGHPIVIKAGAFGVFLLFVIAGIFSWSPKGYAIIAEEATFLMNGPSPGADIEEQLKAGTRLKVLSKDDVWLEVEEGGLQGYVNGSAVLRVP